MNRLVIYKLICESESISRTEISNQTGISGPTVLKVMEYLTQTGLVLETGTVDTPLGRKPQMYTLNKDRFYCIGIHHEGEYLTAGLLNLKSEFKAFKRIHARKSIDVIFDKLLPEVIDGLLAESGAPLGHVMGIGIGLPCVFNSVHNILKDAPSLGIYKEINIEPQIQALKDRYKKDVILDNDLNMGVMGEFNALRLSPEDDLVYISLGTGLGSGVILQGNLRRGVDGMCGEICYMSLCDKIGDPNKMWLENKINLDALTEKFGISDGQEIPEDILDECVEYVSEYLSICINNVLMCYDCGNISLGGHVFSLLGEGLFLAVKRKVEQLAPANAVLYHQASTYPGVVGACLTVMNEHLESELANCNA